uniref:Uncharacterized protein n=1 Tax=Opuntia streptacantha TaxID=393608 RepID=A0A7C9EMK1_OPUST
MSLHIFYFFVLQGLHYRLGDEGSESPIDWSASGCKPNSLVIKWNSKTVMQQNSHKCMGETASGQVCIINVVLFFKVLPVILTKVVPNGLQFRYRSLWNQTLQL